MIHSDYTHEIWTDSGPDGDVRTARSLAGLVGTVVGREKNGTNRRLLAEAFDVVGQLAICKANVVIAPIVVGPIRPQTIGTAGTVGEILSGKAPRKRN